MQMSIQHDVDNKLRQKSIQILKDNGFRITRGKLDIVLSFLCDRTPRTVEQIYDSLSDRPDLVTVYRSVNSLAEKGVIKKINLGGLAAYYEISHADHHHHHIICTVCGMVEDIEDCHTANIETRTLQNSKSFQSITSHSLEFFGVCDSCVLE